LGGNPASNFNGGNPVSANRQVRSVLFDGPDTQYGDLRFCGGNGGGR
jgi:hypothetical protein